MTRFLIFLLSVYIFFVASICNADDSEKIKNMVLCEFSESTKDIVNKINEEDGYRKDNGYFYVPTEPQEVFGYQIEYVGIAGVDMIPGPNVTVRGKFNEVKDTIVHSVDYKFECGHAGCGASLSNSNQIMLYGHPGNIDLTIIQCGYFGP